MKLSLTTTYIFLMVLTGTTILLVSIGNAMLLVSAIIVLSLIKFWLVIFQFMDLKKSHTFWKVLILFFGTLMGIIVGMLL